ncbi:MAG: hypothetical protein ABIH69_03305 [bacterium]
MKRLLFFVCLLLVLIFNSAFSITKWRDSVYTQIEQETIKGLEGSFNAKVSIGKTSGRVIGQAIFENVEIKDFAKVKKIYVNFNLITFLKKKDVVPAITSIKIVGGKFNVKRDGQAKLNVLSLLKPVNPSDPPPPFRAKLIFENCELNYFDEIGFRKKPQGFSEQIIDLRGTISFELKDQIRLSLLGKTKAAPNSPIKIFGSNNYQTGQYQFNITANNLPLAKWGNYTIPLEQLKVQEGETDVSLKISPAIKKGWPVAFSGEFKIKNAALNFADNTAGEFTGELSIVDDELRAKNVQLNLNDIPLKAKGSLKNFEQPNINLEIALNNLQASKLLALFKETKKLDLAGLCTGNFVLIGPLSSPKITGQAQINDGKFYNQAFSGELNLQYDKKSLLLKVNKALLYQGGATGVCKINFQEKGPQLSLEAKLHRIDLAALSQKSPGIEGLASGELKLEGPLSNLKGKLHSTLEKALLFGQPMADISSTFVIENNNISFESFNASSANASLQAFGQITNLEDFSFTTKAQGIKLQGSGILGTMEAMVSFFEGDISWLLNSEFLRSPLRKLNASGKAILSQGKIGEQLFSQAKGQISLKHGLIKVENLSLSQEGSQIFVSGQTGLGQTLLVISGESVSLTDLGIINHFLPPNCQNPTGLANIKATITGELKANTQITSIDPLLDLNIKGELSLANASIANVQIKKGHTLFSWEKKTLSFEKCSLQTSHSELFGQIKLNPQNNLSGSISGTINFDELKKLTSKYGQLMGNTGINLNFSGTLSNPQFAASFLSENFRFNTITFDKVKGSLVYNNHKLIAKEPILLIAQEGEYKLAGEIDFTPLQTGQPEKTKLNLKLKVDQADLSPAIVLSDKIYGEIIRRLLPETKTGQTIINLKNLTMPTIENFIKNDKATLYLSDQTQPNFLKSFKAVAQESQKELAENTESRLGGKVKAEISLSGEIQNLSGNFKGEVANGYFEKYHFDSLKAEGRLDNKIFRVRQLELTKNRGKLKAKGEISFKGEISAEVSANNLPLDILKIVFDKEFAGTFNLNATISGPLQDPNFSTNATSQNLSLAKIDFDEASLSITKNKDQLKIYNVKLTKNRETSTAVGQLTLAYPGKLEIKANLKNDALGLFSLFTNDLKWKKGQGLAKLDLSGSFENLIVNGQINIQDTDLFVSAIDSDIKNIKGQAVISESLVNLESLTGKWQGERTQNYANFIGLAGTIKLHKLLSLNRMVDLNLIVSPYHYVVDLPDKFSGQIKIEKTRLYGPLYLDFSAGPTLVSQAEISNAVIVVGKKESSLKAFPLNFDLELNLKKNVYASMGDISTIDLSTIFMNLELKSDGLKVLGNLSSPALSGKVELKRGSVNIFNQEFSLLSTDQQQLYFPYDNDKVVENVALFSGEEGIFPDIKIVAKVDVENYEEDPLTLEPIAAKVTIVSHLSGILGSNNKTEGLNVSFKSFTEDKTKSPAEMVPANYSEQEIKVMLLPEFIKSLASNREYGANALITDYLDSRIQTFLFRGLERNLEQRLGLESLTLEYNFGKKLRQNMGVQETLTQPDWRVGFVKGFFDQLYIDVRYSQTFKEDETLPAETSFDTQLTYKLSPIWSIIYYAEEPNLKEVSAKNQKISLQARFAFW